MILQLPATETLSEGIPLVIHIIILLAIMLISGILGGYVNYLLRTDPEFSGKPKEKLQENNTTQENNTPNSKAKKILEKAWANIVIAFCATLIVPLFLSTISSTLLSESRTDILKYFVFGGFCLLAAIFSKRFILSMEKQILGKAKEEAADTAKTIAEEVATKLKAETKTAIQDVKEHVKEANKTILFSDILKSWENDYKQGKLSEKIFDEEFIPGLKQVIELEPDPKKDTQIFGEALRFCYNTQKYHIINDLIREYTDKIGIDYISWSDYSIANMNMYNTNPYEIAYKQNILQGCDKALEKMNDYGVSYIVKIFAHLIHKTVEKNADVLKQIDDEITQTFEKINDPVKQYSAYEAYYYIKTNQKILNSFVNKLVEQLKADFSTAFDKMFALYEDHRKKNNLPE